MKIADTIRFLVFIWIVSTALLLPMQGNAAEVILYPGYITGTVTHKTDGYAVRNVYVSASGGGYSASNNFAGDTYSLTVQTGDWEQNVDATATISPSGSSSPYTTISFSPRKLFVGERQTEQNDYSAGGTIRFNVTITGDAYTGWSGMGFAEKNATASQERTHSSSSTGAFTTDGSWLMPVVPNEQIRIYAKIYVSSPTGTVIYTFHMSGDDLLYRDVADGETVDVDLHIDHIAPPAQPPPPPTPGCSSGAVSGNIFLDLNIDGKSYDSSFVKHGVYPGLSCYWGTYSYTFTNPGDYYQDRVRVGGKTLHVSTHFNDAPVLSWPGWDDNFMSRSVVVEEGKTAIKDLSDRVGRLVGHMKFTGTLTNKDLDYFILNFSGLYAMYDQEGVPIPTPTRFGGSGGQFTNSDGSLNFYLTNGPWDSPVVVERTSNNDKGYYSNSETSINDLNYSYNRYLPFGQPTYITDGQTTQYEREYCNGTAVIRFRVNGGGLLSNPVVSGSGYRQSDAHYYWDLWMWVKGYSYANKIEAPEVEIHGPPSDYNLNEISVYAEDNSLIRFTPLPVTLECGVKKIIDINGPQLTVTTPEAYIITNGSSVAVIGTATAGSSITSITINGATVPFSSTGNPDDANEVQFSYNLVTVPGTNTIVTTATDAGGNESSDQRDIHVDPWIPVVEILNPADNSVFVPGTQVPISIDSSDRGYGYKLKMFLNGSLIYATDHTAADDLNWEHVTFTKNILATAADQIIRVEAVDRAGNTASTSITIKGNTPPVLGPVGPYVTDEGSSIVVTATASDPEGGDLIYAWDLDHDGTFETSGQTATFSAALLDGPGVSTIAVQVTDNGGLTDAATGEVTINNVAPTAVLANTSGVINEGESALIAFSNQADASAVDVAAGFLYSYDCDNDGVFELAGSASLSFSCVYADNGIFTVKGVIADKDGGASEYTTTVTVNNVAPDVRDITATLDPIAVGTAIETGAEFTDPGILDTHTAVWNWDDGNTSEGTVTETDGSGSVAGGHVYSTAGVYTVTLTVTDKDNGSDESVFRYVVVYDPGAGFVTGGGFITSPAGAYLADMNLTGKANFGFVAKYKQGATVPTGQTEFNYHVAGFNFHSTSYQWLVIAGAKAQYKGSGTINGQGDYGFMLTGIDGKVNGGDGVDKFRIKIWDKATEEVVYDNQRGETDDSDPVLAIDGGQIVIHKN